MFCLVASDAPVKCDCFKGHDVDEKWLKDDKEGKEVAKAGEGGMAASLDGLFERTTVSFCCGISQTRIDRPCSS